MYLFLNIFFKYFAIVKIKFMNINPTRKSSFFLSFVSNLVHPIMNTQQLFPKLISLTYLRFNRWCLSITNIIELAWWTTKIINLSIISIHKIILEMFGLFTKEGNQSYWMIRPKPSVTKKGELKIEPFCRKSLT